MGQSYPIAYNLGFYHDAFFFVIGIVAAVHGLCDDTANGVTKQRDSVGTK